MSFTKLSPMTNNAQKLPVISDVARRAGVSVPTVSRVLNDAAYVSEDKRKRVMTAIDELGFRPSAAARALVAGRPKLIAVIAGNTSRYGYAETIRGIEEAARSAGYTVTITVIESSDDKTVDLALSLVLGQPIAGILVLKFDAPGIAAIKRIPKTVPTVLLAGSRQADAFQAVLEEAAAAEEAVNYLLDIGHETVQHVRVPPGRKEDGRTVGWRRALTARGKAIPPIIEASWDPQSGRIIGRELALQKGVTAVFCGNDEIALGVMRGVAEVGKSVPHDISVVGFDDHPLAQLWNPALTTVRQDFAELGRRASAQLQALIAGDRPVKQSSERPEFIVRESTAGPSQERSPIR